MVILQRGNVTLSDPVVTAHVTANLDTLVLFIQIVQIEQFRTGKDNMAKDGIFTIFGFIQGTMGTGWFGLMVDFEVNVFIFIDCDLGDCHEAWLLSIVH